MSAIEDTQIRAIGVDFGTTNSVVSVATEGGEIRSFRFVVENQTTATYRSVLCYWREETSSRSLVRHASGPSAIQAYQLEGRYSRLLMSLKSYLASQTFQKARIFSRSIALEDLIATFLTDLFRDASFDIAAFKGPIFAGRPVNFALNPNLNDFAEDRLRTAFQNAGIGRAKFVFEPEAALHSLIQRGADSETALVADLGGGTSDFSVVQISSGSGTKGSVIPLSASGIAIAGDTFDYRIIDNAVTPLLGKGSSYKPIDQYLPVPFHYYQDFARWHALAFMNSHTTLAELRQIQRTSTSPSLIANLIQLVESEKGLTLYRLVTNLKAELSVTNEAILDLSAIGISEQLTVSRVDFQRWIQNDLDKIGDCVDQAIASANVMHSDISAIYLTGGTSLVPAVREVLSAKFGRARMVSGGEFQSVSEGLAILGLEAWHRETNRN